MIKSFYIKYVIITAYLFLLISKSNIEKCRAIFAQKYPNFHFYASECSKNVYKLLDLYSKSGISLDKINVLLILFDKRRTRFGIVSEYFIPALPRERWRSEAWKLHAVLEVLPENEGNSVIFDMDFHALKTLPVKEYFETMFGNTAKVKYDQSPLDGIHIKSIPAKTFVKHANELKSPVDAIRRFKENSSYLDAKHPVMTVREYLSSRK